MLYNFSFRLIEECGVAMYCDMHAHSRRHNIFIYGCENKRNPEKRLTEQVFPLMLHKNSADRVSPPTLSLPLNNQSYSLCFFFCRSLSSLSRAANLRFSAARRALDVLLFGCWALRMHIRSRHHLEAPCWAHARVPTLIHR